MSELAVESYKGRQLSQGDIVLCYRNLTKNSLSLSMEKLVYGHTMSVTLLDVTFKVMQSGNKKTREKKQKNVHAFVKGRLESSTNSIVDIDEAYNKLELDGYQRVYYNPYKVSSFVLFGSQEAIYKTDEAVVIMDRVYIKNY